MFITIKRRTPKDIKNKLGMLFTSVCFVAKMRVVVNRFRKRKLLIKEWIDLQKNNVDSIDTIKQKTKLLQFNAGKANIIMQGLKEIQDQSLRIIDTLTNILTSKIIVFGKTIGQICTNFQVYFQYLKKYVQRQTIIKQKSDQNQNSKYLQNEGNRLTLQQNSRKIIFRTYQISILLSKYIKYLSKNSKDMEQFILALQIITNINKKIDKQLGQEQKSKQIQRLEKMMGEKINTSFIYTEKCYWHLGQIKVHIFELMLIIQENNRLTRLRLDRYCSIFIKFFQNLRLVCLITNTSTVHFLFNFSKQLTKFVKIIQSCIQDEASNQSLLVTQTPYLFYPFLSAKIADFRQSKDKKQEFTIIFSSLCEDAAEQDRSFQRSLVKQSNLNWTEVGYYNQNQEELNERVTLTTNELLKIKKTCQLQYGLKLDFPSFLNFENRVSSNFLRILEWQAYLNTILRSKIIINNPILILKQLHVTDIFLQASLTKSHLNIANNKKQHCKLCSRIVITSLNRYFTQRLYFIFVKYNSNSKEYCYYIFQKIRQEICKISISKLNTCKELIIWRQFRNGVIDYSFRKIVHAQKSFFIEVGMLQIKQQCFQVQINQHSLVSQVIDQICLVMSVPILAGYRLLVYLEEEEIILRPNQLIFSIVEAHNINYQKSYSSTFLSKIKSFGRSLQMSQRGNLILKQVIYYPLSQSEQIQRQYEHKQLSYLFKQDKLTGLSKDTIIELIVLFSIKELIASNLKDLPNSLARKIYQKYIPNSVQQEVEESASLIQRIYNNFKTLDRDEIGKIIQKKLSISQLYRKYVVTVKIVEMSENLCKNKKIKNALVGIGWNEVVILTLNQKIITKFKWDSISITLGMLGLKISNEKSSITFKYSQLYEIYQVLLQYKALNEQIVLIKSK